MQHDELMPDDGWQLPPERRIAPVTESNPGLIKKLFLIGIERIGKLNAANLWTLMMHNMRIFHGMLFYAARLMPYGRLERRDTELAILRVAWLCRSRYEWGQHVDIGLRAGLTTDEIRRVPHGAEAQGWSERQQLIIRACDGFIANSLVDDDTWAALKEHYNEPLLIELLMLIGWYQGLAGVLNSSGIPLDSALEQYLKKI